MSESEYIQQIMTEFCEKIKKSEEPVKIFCIGGGRQCGKTHAIKEALEASGLQVFMVNSKDEIELINGESAIMINGENIDSDESTLEKLKEANEQLRLYEMAPHSASEIIKSNILHQNKINRDQERFRKRHQRKIRK